MSTDTTLDQQTVDDILAEWPDEPTGIAEEMMDRYGLPDEGAPSELLWWDTDPWKRTELYRDGVPHNFPTQHTDYLQQLIDYPVPPEKFDDLARFDGSVYPAGRTANSPPSATGRKRPSSRSTSLTTSSKRRRRSTTPGRSTRPRW
jgi:hypothetical protein